ncbi:MAG: hypothetical protein RXR41_04345 [Candidatus Marsarchaeota archaeon]
MYYRYEFRSNEDSLVSGAWRVEVLRAYVVLGTWPPQSVDKNMSPEKG